MLGDRAVDFEADAARPVGRQRAERGRDVERRAGQVADTVGPTIRLGVEPGVGDGGEPRLHPVCRTRSPEVDVRDDARRNGAGGNHEVAGDAEMAREVVARTQRQHTEHASALRGNTRE